MLKERALRSCSQRCDRCSAAAGEPDANWSSCSLSAKPSCCRWSASKNCCYCCWGGNTSCCERSLNCWGGSRSCLSNVKRSCWSASMNCWVVKMNRMSANRRSRRNEIHLRRRSVIRRNAKSMKNARNGSLKSLSAERRPPPGPSLWQQSEVPLQGGCQYVSWFRNFKVRLRYCIFHTKQ